MARVALGWGVRDLAEKTGLTANTISRIENGSEALAGSLEKIQDALEAACVEFTNGDAPGVRFRKRTDVQPRRWVAFTFLLDGTIRIGFARYDALEYLEPTSKEWLVTFDKHAKKLIQLARELIAAGKTDEGGRTHIGAKDLAKKAKR
jgi:transcriptional regulator with XRE-family HTH domain